MQPAIITGYPSCSPRILANAFIGAALSDQSTVDKTTEEWLGEIERRLDCERWYCGHFCAAKSVDRMRFGGKPAPGRGLDSAPLDLVAAMAMAGHAA